MKIRILFFLLNLLPFFLSAQEAKVSIGTIKHLGKFKTTLVAPRRVDVWLPVGYDAKKKYAVLYMHDGQMLFDSTVTWNHTAWNVDLVLGKLMAEKKIKECIVVGIWNVPNKRHLDYFPQKAFESLSKRQQDSLFVANKEALKADSKNPKMQSDNYLKFLVTELKPYIDRNFSSLTDRANTFICGSSMGGLISMYAICEYPQVFGGAACLSTHWPGTFSVVNNPIPAAFLAYLKAHLPDPSTHKIYFDYGSETLDAMYKPFQMQADVIMKEKGFTSKNWITMEFPGTDHSEKSWSKRFDVPMVFLFGGNQ